jgi:hypothetical protein
MDSERVVEHRQSTSAHWLRERRLRIALLIAFVESVLVLFSDHGWWFVVLAAVVAVIAHWFVGRRLSGIVHEVTWVAAVSQLIAVMVPVLWVLVKTIAIIVLVGLALFLLVALLVDRR